MDIYSKNASQNLVKLWELSGLLSLLKMYSYRTQDF